LLVAFLSTVLVEVQSIQLEATTFGAFVSLLLTILVIRPSFKFPQSRLWSLGAYAVFAGVASFQILLTESLVESPNYLTTAGITILCFISALIASLKRVNRLSLRKKKKTADKAGDELVESENKEETGLEAEASITPAPEDSTDTNLPPAIKPVPGKKPGRKVVMKPGKAMKEAKEPVDEPVQIEEAPSPVKKPIASRKPIPSQPISEEQKDVIRNRLARKDRLMTPANSNGDANSEEGNQASPRQLSTEEIKAQLASRLKRSSSIGKEPSKVDTTPSSEPSTNSDIDTSTKRRTISLKKADKEENQPVPN
jgi:hypothetical protein